MGGAVTRCFCAEAQPQEGGKAHRRRKRSHGKSASPHHQAAPVPAGGRGSDSAGVPVSLTSPAPASGSAASKAALTASQPFAAVAGKSLGGGGATLLRSESGLDVFYDAREVFDDTSALAEAPFAFARHALCAEPAGGGHTCAASAAASAASAAATTSAAAPPVDGEPGKTAEVEQLESLGAAFGEDFWSGKGSLAGRGLKALQALRHLKDVDLSRFSGVPISQHLPVSGSQMLHKNSFMPGRAPPASRLDAHLRAELPAAMQANPLERFLVVLRAHIALLDAPAQSLRKPFNPVLGETSRILHFVQPGAPPVTAICEQVSHHPPVTAFASWDAALRCSYTGWVDIAPRFMGLAIRVPMTGERCLMLPPLSPGAPPERYRATIPAMEWHFVPAVRAEYSGTWHLWCDETGLTAEVTHLTKSFMGLVGKPNRIEGRIIRTLPRGAATSAAAGEASPRRRRSAEHEVLFEFDGEFDGCVWLRPVGATARSGGGRERSAPRLLWDAVSAAALEAKAPPPQAQPELEAKPAESVWGAVFRALQEGAWDAARRGKEEVEVAERVARRERAARAERWVPTWFVPDARTGGWAPRE